MSTTYEMPIEAIASVTKILGRNKLGASDSLNLARAEAGRIIINANPEASAEMRDQIRKSVLGLYSMNEHSGLDIADVISCWATAFPHKVCEIMECVTDMQDPLPFEHDPHAEGYVVGLFEVANVILVSNPRKFSWAANEIY